MLLTIFSILSILFLQGWMLDFKTVQGAVVAFIAVVCALWVWKSGIPQQLFKGYQDLEKLRTAERDTAIKERDAALTELKEFKEENRSLRREVSTRIEIYREDQAEIARLKEELRRCKSS